ncbi:MAG TPA: hypothetical protein VEG25_03865 [Burkholderiales bacterium]|nr:hypothetical protein [Burkholderiales bacterium]
MNSISNLLSDVFVRAFLIFIAGGCVLSLLVGLWMVFKPNVTLRLNQYFNRWYATDKLSSVFSSRHDIDEVLHRHNRFVGALVLGGSLYYLVYALFFAVKSTDLTSLLLHNWSEPVGLWLEAALIVILVGGNVLAVLVGLGLLFRPSLITHLEAWANSSYESEELRDARNAMRVHRRPLERHIRLVGVLVVAGSIYALAAFWIGLGCPPLQC